MCAALCLIVPGAVFAHGGFEERIDRISTALEAEPDNAALHLELAGVRCEHGEWPEALIELGHVDRLAPGQYGTDLLRGEAYLVGKLPAPAKRALDRFIAAHPSHAKALVLRARAHAALKDSAACLADFDAAWQATARPEPDLVQEYSNALAALGQNEKSLEVLVVGIEKVGAVPGLVQLALEREVAAGRFDAALSRIALLQKTAPRPEPWMAKRAGLLARAGRTAEAYAAWQGLIDHLAALPNLERGSHAMSILAEQARRELAALAIRTSASSTFSILTSSQVPPLLTSP